MSSLVVCDQPSAWNHANNILSQLEGKTCGTFNENNTTWIEQLRLNISVCLSLCVSCFTLHPLKVLFLSLSQKKDLKGFKQETCMYRRQVFIKGFQRKKKKLMHACS